ncbi:uncharacterized protein IWZ02DRAFT_104354 [Phyllosticta citriasiana]|uniref:Uncharacterized protein n=1 Tax=Phyllosticta citriasiana TaxID=595635 RepID=A0ABR1KHB2_9PEZI
MGLELWSYPNDSPRKSCATKKDAAASSRSPIRRRHAPPVIRRTIDLRRIPPSSFVSPSVRDASAAADASRRTHSVDVASNPDSEESDEPPRLEEVSLRREHADHGLPRRYLGMDLTSRPPRDSVARDGDERARSSSGQSGGNRATSTSGIGPLRRARPLRDDSLEIARRAVNRRSRPLSDHTGEERYRERRAAWLASDATDFPPLRRMGRRQVTDGPLPPSGLRQSSLRESWGPASVDGLGDRERSVSSPPSDHWETILSTITPDAQLPSADSSFTSAAASASFSTSNTTSQAGTGSTRSASDGSTPTDLTEPLIQRDDEEQLFCETEDEDDVLERYRFDDRGSRRRPRITRDEDGNHHVWTSDVWTTAPSPPTRNPSRYSSDAHSRLREITNIVRNHHTGRAPSASRSQSPRSRNDVPDVVDSFIDAPTNDDRRDSAAIVPYVSRPGSTRNEQSPEVTTEREAFELYFVDPDDPDQTPNRVPGDLPSTEGRSAARLEDYLREINELRAERRQRQWTERNSADDSSEQQ